MSTRRAQKSKLRRQTSPAPRVQQRPAAPRASGRGAPAPRARNPRVWALSLAALGVSLGIYALAPRSEAKRSSFEPAPRTVGARTSALPSAHPEPEPPQELGAAEEPTAADEAPELAEDAQPQSEAQKEETKPMPEGFGVGPTHAQLGAEEKLPELEEPVVGARFGASDVPNARTHVVRMSGPVLELEGSEEEDGFTVRIPGRLALDRASPIAHAHKSVKRAAILNRGDYAELKVDFASGPHPAYQVVAKGKAIEISLERK